MVSHLFYYQLALFVLVWLFVMLHVTWPKPGLPTTPVPAQPRHNRSNEPKTFEGVTKSPIVPCVSERPRIPNHLLLCRPIPTNRRPRTVDTSMHFCPHTDCDYRGWLGLNNLRANGSPSGGPWRQLRCTSCNGYFPSITARFFMASRRLWS